MDLLLQPVSQSGKVTASDELIQVWNVLLCLSKVLASVDGPQAVKMRRVVDVMNLRIGGEITKGARGPVYILKHTLSIIPWCDAWMNQRKMIYNSI